MMCWGGSANIGQRIIWLMSFGIVSTVIGIVLLICWPDWSLKILHNRLILREGGENYNNWVEAPIPIYLNFYLFNWTNPQDIRKANVKPNFVEMGPYVFLEKHHKENITFYSNDTVSYYQRRTWFFDQEKSNGSLDDLLTTAHVITATLADEMRHKNSLIKKVVNFMLNHEGGKLYITKSIREWIFDGYQDDLIDFLNMFNTSNIKIPYSRFGWLVDRNASLEYDGLFTIHTGADNINTLGTLSNWKGNIDTDFYPKPCGMVKGTMGDLFRPNLKSDDQLIIFVTDACRYLNLKPNGTVQRDGLSIIHWIGDEETLDSGSKYSYNKCFCTIDKKDCPKSGVVECKKCRNKAPIYLSFPHFYLADESYYSAVNGLKPDLDKHSFDLFVEPITGAPLEVRGRLQINMMITRDDNFDIYRGIQSFLMPMFWFEQIAELNNDLIYKTKVAANLEMFGFDGGIILTSLGVVMCITGLGLLAIFKWERSIDDEDEDILTTT